MLSDLLSRLKSVSCIELPSTMIAIVEDVEVPCDVFCFNN